MSVYEKGKVKVVWISEDPQRIYSKMFSEEKEALKFAKTREDYIVFSLVKQENMEEFEWRLLPYGRHKLYLKTIALFQNNKGGVATFVENML